MAAKKNLGAGQEKRKKRKKKKLEQGRRTRQLGEVFRGRNKRARESKNKRAEKEMAADRKISRGRNRERGLAVEATKNG